ncbi:MAG TPA: hypothetical protein VFW47_07375 [Phenylobacterium sp.]|nr:hypothetical protein [Phenylobacterium sp.]
MSEHLYLLTISLVLGTILFIFGMKYASSAAQSRARLANDNAYRELAEKAVAGQAETVASLSAAQGGLSRIETRLAAIEKILNDVG